MKRLLIALSLLHLNSLVLLNAQTPCTDTAKIKFTGVAPAPWAIDGLVNDWETILGPGTGDPSFPYTPPATSSFNYFNETTDLDQPEAGRDLRFFSFTHDDYNVYFYFRRMQNGNGQNTFFYFCDINADGFMNTGEPVFFANFNSKNISPISIGSYIPNTSVDYFLNKGNSMVKTPPVSNNPFYPQTCSENGYSMQGNVDELFNASSIPTADALNTSEVFGASITEDGFGVEFAIPWKYLKNWSTLSAPLNPIQHRDIFTYHISLINGGGKYQASKVAENAGGCHRRIFGSGPSISGNDLAISGSPDFYLLSSSITTIEPGLSYKIKLTYLNLTNVTEFFFLKEVSFKNIVASPGATVNEHQFTAGLGIDDNCNGLFDGFEESASLNYSSGSFSHQPIIYSSLFAGGLPVVNPGQSICVIIEISLPPDNSVQSCEVEIRPKAAFFILEECEFPHVAPDGGKPINPVGFDLGLEPEVTRSKQYQISSEILNDFGNKITIYPNPSKGNTNVLLPLELKDAVITLSDYSGKIIRKLITSGQRLVRLENLKAGFYILHVRSKDARMQSTKKLIVQ